MDKPMILALALVNSLLTNENFLSEAIRESWRKLMWESAFLRSQAVVLYNARYSSFSLMSLRTNKDRSEESNSRDLSSTYSENLLVQAGRSLESGVQSEILALHRGLQLNPKSLAREEERLVSISRRYRIFIVPSNREIRKSKSAIEFESNIDKGHKRKHWIHRRKVYT